jgi:DNA polymerase-4
MNAFYASVQLLRYPELRGLPVVVGGGSRHQPVLQPDGRRAFARLRDYAGRGVITTATYAARDLGVHSGLGLMKAAVLAPDAVLLPTDFDTYRQYSRRFKAAVAEAAPVIEDRGIDEIYIDLTDVAGALHTTDEDIYSGVRLIAREIKSLVTAATGLTCSMGITPNKILSKLCSDLDKPDGLTILTAVEIPGRIWLTTVAYSRVTCKEAAIVVLVRHNSATKACRRIVAARRERHPRLPENSCPTQSCRSRGTLAKIAGEKPCRCRAR